MKGARSAVLLGLILSASVTACDDAGSEAEPYTVRDSMGVVIAESVSPLWTSATAWRADSVVVRIEIDDASPENSPLDPVSVFRSQSGEIVIADGNQVGWHRVLVYDAEGRFQRAFGRKGEGPCEFGQVWQAYPYRGDSIAVFDMARRLVHVFSAKGDCGAAFAVPATHESQAGHRMTFVPSAYGVYADGDLLASPFGTLDRGTDVGADAHVHHLLRIDRDRADTIDLGRYMIMETYWDGRLPRRLYYGRVAIRALDGNDLIYGDAASYQVMRFDSAGVLKQIIRRAWQRERVTEADQRAALEMSSLDAGAERAPSNNRPDLKRRIAESHWAETLPPYSSIVVDDAGSIWVEDYRQAYPGWEVPPGPSRWSVFSPEGRWLGVVDLPGQFFLMSAYDDIVYGIWQDESGVRSIRGYRLTKPGS